MTIPRSFHAYWDGGSLPDEFRGYLNRWVELHGYPLELWDHGRYLKAFPTADSTPYYLAPERWSPTSNIWQWRSNIARYEILLRYGGIWVDCDLEPLRSIEPLLERGDVTGALIARESRFVNNAFIAATENHPFIADILGGIVTSIRANRHYRSNRSTGAVYITRVAQRHRDRLVVLEPDLIYPYRWDELQREGETFPDAYTIHHWHHARTERSVRR